MSRGRQSKVERLISEYDLEPLGDELVESWTADEERMSLRELASHFNRRLVAATLEEVGAVDVEPEPVYEVLTDDEVTSGRRTELRTRLEQAGVDVESLEQSFVSYQAIRSYVKDVRDAELEQPSDEEQIETERDTIQRLISRTQSVAEKKLHHLHNTGRIALGDIRLTVDVSVYCRDCGTRRSVAELLDQGGCECDR
jgi:hypothetical protein